MKRLLTFFIICSFFSITAIAQTGIGIGIYPTGTETGLGFRSGKNSKFFVEGCITKANLYNSPIASSALSELAMGVRVVKLEKVFLNIGLGVRAEYNSNKNNKIGAIIPISVEAFPFPFQNAGLFFGAGLFYTSDLKKDTYAGIRTAAGFVFYFPKKQDKKS